MISLTKSRLFTEGFLFIALIAMSGCTTVTKEQCEAINWYGNGYETAMQGGLPEQASKHESNYTCNKEYGLTPKYEQVSEGYKEGLLAFCTRRQGQRFGESGGYYQQTCSEKSEPQFLAGYQLGRIEYMGSRMSQLETQVHKLRSEVDDRNRTIDRLRSDLDDARNKDRRLR